jgi:hypothetical protein
MNRLDLPDRCLKPIDAQSGDRSAYYIVCCKPEGHAHGCMSLAVDDSKEAARKARNETLPEATKLSKVSRIAWGASPWSPHREVLATLTTSLPCCFGQGDWRPAEENLSSRLFRYQVPTD